MLNQFLSYLQLLIAQCNFQQSHSNLKCFRFRFYFSRCTPSSWQLLNRFQTKTGLLTSNKDYVSKSQLRSRKKCKVFQIFFTHAGVLVLRPGGVGYRSLVRWSKRLAAGSQIRGWYSARTTSYFKVILFTTSYFKVILYTTSYFLRWRNTSAMCISSKSHHFYGV